MAFQVVLDYLYRLLPNTLAITSSIFFTVLIILGTALYRRYKFMQRCNKIPGPPPQIPLFGSITDVSVAPDKLVPFLVNLYHTWSKGAVARVWIGPLPFMAVASAESVEAVLSSNKIIDKSREYNFIQPWLATGLLTSTGGKWRQRRKLLTPTFHFKILEDFIHVFNEQGAVLAEKLKGKVGQEFDVFPYITRCTLDVICETAMGRHVDAQSKGDSEYVKAVYQMSHIIQARQILPWLQPNFLFNLFSYGSEQKRCLSILHGFTDKVIRERKIENKLRKAQEEQQEKSLEKEDDDGISKKPRLAFLDLLIEASQDGKVLSDLDIREEVDTFMFEGHDTTAAAISWSLFLIGNHPNVQERVHDELNRIFGDSDRSITMADLNELKYLECCIKEALRLYPSVPIFARAVMEDIDICGHEIPIGSTVGVAPYILHRDPTYFPDPEKFQPERFFPENSRGRHPYAYVPFSAGPRNCIGQKFALMEEKIIVASVFRHFNVKALDKQEGIPLLAELILRPRDGILVHLSPRKIEAKLIQD